MTQTAHRHPGFRSRLVLSRFSEQDNGSIGPESAFVVHLFFNTMKIMQMCILRKHILYPHLLISDWEEHTLAIITRKHRRL